ncbi:unnamed protein product [Notodromas monacha]|uniref:PDZ domain-containing protein n=1 Tax=Notodromas monacha TaxID=399045 RepID=A0A7R9BFN4_9CRUS|nr:unnamed protein product [Notodromas monacha]CAG0912974.1 unnamed protein product [Notodromas monacha]
MTLTNKGNAGMVQRSTSSAVHSVWSFMRSCVNLRHRDPYGLRAGGGLSYEDDTYGSFIVELEKSEEFPHWGLILAGGADRGAPVVVASLRRNSIADVSDSLQPGDFIMAVNGSLTDVLKHGDLIELLTASSLKLSLEVGYDMQPVLNLSSTKDAKKLTYAKAMQVRLSRPLGCGLGIILRGGYQEHTGRNYPLIVSYIRPGGAAADEGSIQVGDRVVAINGISLFQATLSDAVRILSSSDGIHETGRRQADVNRRHQMFTLTVEYDVDAIEEKSKAKGPLTVDIPCSSDGSSLGVQLGISFWDGASIVVEAVRPGSIVDRCGALHPGDRILMINGVAVEGIQVAEVNEILERRVLKPWKILIIPSHLLSGNPKIAGDWRFVSSRDMQKKSKSRRHSFSKPATNAPNEPQTNRSSSLTRSVRRDLSSKPPLAPRDSVMKRADSDPGTCKRLRSETHIVELWPDYRRDFDHGYYYGFTVSGKTFGEDGLLESPPVISAVDPQGSARRCGVIQEGDRILSVNGRAFASFSLESLCSAIAEMKPPLSIMLAFDISDPHSPAFGNFYVTIALNGRPPGVTFMRRFQMNESIREGGLRIDTIIVGSPAHRCGNLVPGDVITAVEDYNLNEFWADDEVIATMQSASDPVRVKVSREQQAAESGTVLDRVDGYLYKVGKGSNASLEKSVFDSWGSLFEQTCPKSPRAKTPSPSFSLTNTKRSLESLGSLASTRCNSAAGQNLSKSDVKVLEEENSSFAFDRAGANSASGIDSTNDPWEDLLRSLRAAGRSPSASCASLTSGKEKDIKSGPGKGSSFVKKESIEASDVASVGNRRDRYFCDVPDVVYPELARGGAQSSASARPETPEDSTVEILQVQLTKDPVYDDFGFSLSDGLSVPGVYVNRIRPNGPADVSGKIRPMDRILEVHGIDTRDLNCCMIVPLVASSGETLDVAVARKPGQTLQSSFRYLEDSRGDSPLARKPAGTEKFILCPNAEMSADLDVDISDPNGNQKRTEKSLGILTQRFVELLQTTQGGIIDLKQAAQKLEVRQKRRLYDITNVLEGIGLIRKCGKNFVQWRGGKLLRRPVEGSGSQGERSTALRDEIFAMRSESERLDSLIQMTSQSVKNMFDDEDFTRYCYVTPEDIQLKFPDDDEKVVLGVHSEQQSSVQVYQPMKVEVPGRGVFVRRKLSLKCEDGPIDMFLLNQDGLKKSKASKNASKLHWKKETPMKIKAEDVNDSEAFLGDLNCRNICQLLNGHFAKPENMDPEFDADDGDDVSFELPYLKHVVSPTEWFNRMMGVEEGSRNLFDIDVGPESPYFVEAPSDPAEHFPMDTTGQEASDKNSRSLAPQRRAAVED